VVADHARHRVGRAADPGCRAALRTQTVIDNTFDLVDKLVASQREFAHNLVTAASPATKSTASTSKPLMRSG
jgi:hypothetical protein